MIDPKKSAPKKRKRPMTVLALSFDGSQMEGVVVRRTNGALQLLQQFSATLTLNLLTAEPELMGREIRNQLDAAGVRERNCVVCLPGKWALTISTDIPDLPEADVSDFLQVETERGFASDVTSLSVASSRFKSVTEKRYATSLGIPLANVGLLEKALEHAKLKPLCFSPGISVLEAPSSKLSEGVLALVIGDSQVDLQITAGGGVVSFRTIEGCFETEGVRRSIRSDLLLREIRITLGQLPAGIQEAVRSVRIYGPRDLAERLAGDSRARMEPMGIEVMAVTAYRPNEFSVQLPSGVVVSSAFSFAARWLVHEEIPFDFLPPKVTPWQQLVQKYSSGRLQMIGALVGFLVLITLAAFGVQQYKLSSLEGEWSKMSGKVADLESVQQQIRQYSPWFDDSFRCLSILKLMTESFPEEGSVSAKIIEIRNTSVVTCSGVAQNTAAFLKTRSQLQGVDGVLNLKVDQMRGKSPVEFTFDFHWNDGGNSEN